MRISQRERKIRETHARALLVYESAIADPTATPAAKARAQTSWLRETRIEAARRNRLREDRAEKQELKEEERAALAEQQAQQAREKAAAASVAQQTAQQAGIAAQTAKAAEDARIAADSRRVAEAAQRHAEQTASLLDRLSSELLSDPRELVRTESGKAIYAAARRCGLVFLAWVALARENENEVAVSLSSDLLGELDTSGETEFLKSVGFEIRKKGGV